MKGSIFFLRDKVRVDSKLPGALRLEHLAAVEDFEGVIEANQAGQQERAGAGIGN